MSTQPLQSPSLPSTGGGPTFPVGYIMITADATNPATWLGYGTWTAIGPGRVLIGDNGGTYPLGATGGAETSSHTHPAGTLTTDTFAAHTHGAGTLLPSAHSGTAVDAHSGTAVSAHSGTAVDAHSASDFNHKHDITTAGNATISAHSGTAVGDHSAHTHDGGTYVVADHTHSVGTLAVSAHTSVNRGTGGSATAATNGHTLSGATGTYPGAQPGVTGNSGNPSATLSHSVTQPSAHTLGGGTQLADGLSGASLSHSVTQPANHTVTQPSNHVVTQPSAHTMSGSTASDGAHNHSVNSGSTGSTASSTVQPYLVVTFWQRTL